MDSADVVVGFLPEHAAMDALFQSLPAPLHVAVKYVIKGDLRAASLDDVTANLRRLEWELCSYLVVWEWN